MALAWRLRDDFFSASDLGRPVSRLVSYQLRSIVNQGGSWSKVPIGSTIDLREKARMGLEDARFNGRQTEFDGTTRLDIIDRDVMSRNLIDWCLVRRTICATCGKVTDATFAKGMRGLWGKFHSADDYSHFGSAQDFVDSVVRQTDFRRLI
jgi:hypothetical protein